MLTALLFSDDEHDEMLKAVRAGDYIATLWDLDQWLRGRIKYDVSDRRRSEHAVLEEVRAHLWELLNGYNISIE